MKVAVVGGGLSGLVVAHGLAARGRDVVVLEASPFPGGVLRTMKRDGFLMEMAANGYLDREPATTALVEALGLSSRTRPAAETAKKRFILTRGALREVKMSPPGFLMSDLLPWSAKLRLAGELFSGRATGDESVAQFARRHLGARATAVMVDAMQTGIFAGDVEKLSLPAAFPRMRELEKNHRSLILALVRLNRARKKEGLEAAGPAPSGVLTSFDGGMQTLVDTLAAALGDRLRLGAAARALRRDGDRWIVSLGDGEVAADEVVLACPSWIAAELLRPHAAEAAELINAIPHAAVNAVHLAWRELPDAPVGFGFLIPSEENRRILGALFIHSFFPWRVPDGSALLTLMVGGARRPELAALDDAAIRAMVLDEVRTSLGITREPSFIEIVRWDRGIPQYEVGHLARMEQVDARMAAVPHVHLLGHAYRGVGVNECIKHGSRLAERLGAG